METALGPEGTPDVFATLRLAGGRTLAFLALPDGGRAIDLTVSLSPAGGPVTLGDVKDAGLCCVRVAAAISATPTVTSAAGVTSNARLSTATPVGAILAHLLAVLDTLRPIAGHVAPPIG